MSCARSRAVVVGFDFFNLEWFSLVCLLCWREGFNSGYFVDRMGKSKIKSGHLFK